MLRIGTQVVDITPPIGPPTGLAGFGGKTSFASGIMMPLLASSIVVDNGIEIVGFVSCDLLCLLPETIKKIKELIYKGTNGLIKEDNIWIGCTHTHQGPDTIGIFYPGENFTNKPDTEYLAILVRYIAGSIIGAFNNMQDSCSYAITTELEWRFSMNRRLEAPLVPGISRSVDPQIGVINFKNKEDKIIGVIINYAAHATTLENTNTLLSPDYIGFIREFLRKNMHLDNDLAILFFNGPCGDINPSFPNLVGLSETIYGQFNSQAERYEIPIGQYIEARMLSIERVEQKLNDFIAESKKNNVGSEKNDTELRILNNIHFIKEEKMLIVEGKFEKNVIENILSRLIRLSLMKPMESIEFSELMGEEIALKVINAMKKMKYKENLELSNVCTKMIAESEDPEQLEEFPFFKHSKSFVPPEQNNGKPGIEVEVNCMKFGEAMLVGLPGEVTNEISMRLKSLILQTKKLSFVFNFELLNGEIGYILSPEDYEIGGYETLISIGPNNGFRMEQLIINSASQLLQQKIDWKREVEIPTVSIARIKNLKVQID